MTSSVGGAASACGIVRACRACGQVDTTLPQHATEKALALNLDGADDPTIRTNRLALCDLTGRTLAIGLDLLGIPARERM